MSVLDIRKTADEPITNIVFADEGRNYVTATSLMKRSDHFRIVDEDDDSNLIIESKEQAENLIKAIEKAIELNWVE